jgi:hypothetical protein
MGCPVCAPRIPRLSPWGVSIDLPLVEPIAAPDPPTAPSAHPVPGAFDLAKWAPGERARAHGSRLRLVTMTMVEPPLAAGYLPPKAPRISTQNTAMMTAPKSAAMMRTPSTAKSKGSST